MTRAVPGLVVQLPEPAISAGQPSLPAHWAEFSADATLIEGPGHIHAIPDPNPAWDPRTGGWTTPPPPPSDGGAGDFRWTVDSLPDPAHYPDGWYWLGDVRVAGENHAVAGDAWGTAPGSPVGPTWRSFFPYRPSVSAHDAYIPGSKRIRHPKGLHVNSHFVEHMWADFGTDRAQPFTWIVVAMVVSNPFPGYVHNLLDSGRDPDTVGFPRLSAGAVSTPRQIGDNLPYRTSLAIIGAEAQLTTSVDAPLRVAGSPGLHPTMYAAVFNGQSSQVGSFDPFVKRASAGGVANWPGYNHRYMVLGRAQGWISQARASNMLIFEMRYWHRALTPAELDAQYAQLSSTHQFDAYRRL
jgi:hypothetical protein